jgi:hypothetical protein
MSRLGRVLEVLVLMALLPRVDAYAHTLVTDLNGDGRNDRVETGARARDLIVTLSDEGRTIVHLRTRAVVVGIAAADVDRDGHVDLVANTTRGLRLWLNNGRGGFARQRSLHRHGLYRFVPGRLGIVGHRETSAEILVPDVLSSDQTTFHHDTRGAPVSAPLAASSSHPWSITAVALRGPPVTSSARPFSAHF